MNRTTLKKANLYAVDGGIYAIYGEGVNVLWRIQGFRGDGRRLLPHEVTRVSPTTAFKKATPELDGDAVVWKHGRVTVRVGLTDGDTAKPDIPDEPKLFPWDKRIMKVRKATGKDRWFENLLFDPKRIIASDGFRLHALDIETGAEKQTPIWAAAIDLLNRLKPEEFGIYEDGLYARGDDWVAWVHKDDRGFEDYDRVIPPEFVASMRVNGRWSEELKAAIQTADDENKRVDILPNGDLEHDNIHIKGLFAGEHPWERVPYNGKYLYDALDLVDDAEIRFNSDKTPTLITNGEAWAVLVPLRI